MPFEERSIMSHREEFCRLATAPGANVRELCRRFGICPTSGYKWIERWRAEGREGLSDRSRRPLTSPGRSSPAVEEQVLAVRRAHPRWGGRKIRRVLQREGLAEAPSASTATAILRRHGLLDGPRAGEARDWRRFESAAANDLWQMDFKGHVATAVGRLHPLTVLDDRSRYSLVLAACGDEREATVRARLTGAFRRYGLPWRMLADNGSPWGSAGGEPTRFAVWLMDLDVALIHGRPYHPQTQGKEERFHRTLKGEVLDGRTFRSLEEAETAFAAWREVYNSRRPHEPPRHARDDPAARLRAAGHRPHRRQRRADQLQEPPRPLPASRRRQARCTPGDRRGRGLRPLLPQPRSDASRSAPEHHPTRPPCPRTPVHLDSGLHTLTGPPISSMAEQMVPRLNRGT
jgi:transposase InsO family protein